MNQYGHVGYYSSIGFTPDSPGVYSEESLPYPTLEGAFRDLEKKLRASFDPARDQVLIDNYSFTSLDEAIAELRARHGIVVPGSGKQQT